MPGPSKERAVERMVLGVRALDAAAKDLYVVEPGAVFENSTARKLQQTAAKVEGFRRARRRGRRDLQMYHAINGLVKS
jgi:hypothetical protein